MKPRAVLQRVSRVAAYRGKWRTRSGSGVKKEGSKSADARPGNLTKQSRRAKFRPDTASFASARRGTINIRQLGDSEGAQWKSAVFTALRPYLLSCDKNRRKLRDVCQSHNARQTRRSCGSLAKNVCGLGSAFHATAVCRSVDTAAASDKWGRINCQC